MSQSIPDLDSTSPKLNWGTTILLGLIPLSTELLWRIYNNFVPLYLQSGSAVFATSEATTMGFGLNAFACGLIMGLDNLAALFLLPLVGAISNRTRTRLGRRMPFVLVCAPVAALLFALIPLVAGRIVSSTNGTPSATPGLFALFVFVLCGMLLAMACFFTPAVSLVRDLTPAALQSKANRAINLMVGLAGVIGALVLSPLFDVAPWIPFVCGAVLLVAATAILLGFVREPEASAVAAPDEEGENAAAAKKMSDLPEESRRAMVYMSESRRTLLFWVLAIFCWSAASHGIEAWFTSFGVTVLGLSPGRAGQIYSVALIALVLSAVPAESIGRRLGRRRTIAAGLVSLTGALLAITVLRTLTAIAILLTISGAGWALVNINALSMLLGTSTDERVQRMFSTMYFAGSQLAAIVGPALIGWAVDVTGGNFNTVFVVAPAFLGLAVLILLLAKRAESRQTDAL